MIIRTRYCLVATTLAILIAASVQADSVQLTLDLTNNDPTDPSSGGTWQLFARKVETSSGAQGDFGIASIRALINNINIGSITYAPGTSNVDQATFCGGDPCYQTMPNGTIELNYIQNLSAPGVVTGVGVSANPNLDRLIASGSWAAGLRPTFGNDGSAEPGGPFSSDANFLGAASPPFGNAVVPDSVLTTVVTVGDLDGSNTITPADLALFDSFFLPNPPPYNPAADLNQSGTITGVDRVLLLDLGNIPEPSSLMLIGLAAMTFAVRRR